MVLNNVRTEFENKADDFRRYFSERKKAGEDYGSAIKILAELTESKALSLFSEHENTGALPSSELHDVGFAVEFNEKWSNHAEAREWAEQVLRDRTTFAADGSQMYAEKTTSIPVAAVRIGWFENPHSSTARYEKNTSIKILTPDDLFKEQSEPMNPDIRVEQQRYLGEIERVAEFINNKSGWSERGERMPVAFFDNPLLVPFSQNRLQSSLLAATVELVKTSKAAKVPVVGYVASGYSRDLLTMLETAFPDRVSRKNTLYDAVMLNTPDEAGDKILKKWGDRTCFFYSKRQGLADLIDPETGLSSAGFIYLQTTSDAAPARADIPAWVYEAGLINELADVIRAECVVGLGYPYALETADQTAVITGLEREMFFRALQEFAETENLDFTVSPKNASKKRRR